MTTSLKSRHIGPEMLRSRLQLLFVVQTAIVDGAWPPHVIRDVHSMLVAKHKGSSQLNSAITFWINSLVSNPPLPPPAPVAKGFWKRRRKKKIWNGRRRQTLQSGIETRSCRALTQVFSALWNIAETALKLCAVLPDTVIVAPEEVPAPFLTSHSDAFLYNVQGHKVKVVTDICELLNEALTAVGNCSPKAICSLWSFFIQQGKLEHIFLYTK